MGVNPSKFLKHSYVVSEGVQTDLSIESFNEEHDHNGSVPLCKTPPRQVHRLSDPRSVTRGIIRTPIMCEVVDGKEIFSPVKEKRKPYLETNLDDLLPCYIPPDPCDHLTDLGLQSAHVSIIRTDNGEPISVGQLKDSSDRSVNIEIPDIGRDAPIQQEDENDTLTSDCDEICLNLSQPDNLPGPETDFPPLIISDAIEEGMMISGDCRYPIDSSETVERVCQRILDELLNSKDDICVNESQDSGDELFVDDEDDDSLSQVTESLRNLVIKAPTPGKVSRSPTLDKNAPLVYHENYTTPTSSKPFPKNCDKTCLPTLDQQPLNTPSPRKRKPLGEVNRNRNIQEAQCYQGPFSSLAEKVPTQMDSPLKSILPLLHPQSAPHSKPHRSHWDSENTLII